MSQDISTGPQLIDYATVMHCYLSEDRTPKSFKQIKTEFQLSTKFLKKILRMLHQCGLISLISSSHIDTHCVIQSTK